MKLLQNKHETVDSSFFLILQYLDSCALERRLYDYLRLSWEVQLEALSRAHGIDNDRTAPVLANLAGYYSAQGQLDSAESLCIKVLSKSPATTFAGNMAVARCLAVLGNVKSELGEYGIAESLYTKSIAVHTELGIPDSIKFAAVLADCGVNYYFNGQYDLAESFLMRAIAIDSLLPRADIASDMDQLANVYADQGRSDKAERYYRRALGIRLATCGPLSRNYAKSLNNLGTFLDDIEEYQEAESLLSAALKIRGSPDSLDSAGIASTLSNLASLYDHTNRYDSAATLYLGALAIDSALHGRCHPFVARDLRNLASHYRELGQYVRANAYFAAALSIKDSTVSPFHPNTASLCEAYSQSLLLAGKRDSALQMARRAFDVRRRNLLDEALLCSPNDALDIARSEHRAAGRLLTLLVGASLSSDPTDGEVSEIVWSTKGMVSDLTAARAVALSSERNEVISLLRDSLKIAQRELSQAYAASVGGVDKSNRLRVEQLDLVVGVLNERLAQMISSHGNVRWGRPLSVKDVSSLLDRQTVLVEYFRYDRVPEVPIDAIEPHYLAVVVANDGIRQAKDLGRASEIDALVRVYRKQIDTLSRDWINLGKPALDSLQATLLKLDQILWAPLVVSFSGARAVFIAPDGALNLLSFATLKNEQNKYLIEECPIVYISSGRELSQSSSFGPTGMGLLALGNPDYDASEKSRALSCNVIRNNEAMPNGVALRSATPKCIQLSVSKWDRRVFTEREISQAAQSWRLQQRDTAILLTGAAASEENFKSLCSGRQVIHIATHGYYRPGLCDSADNEDASGSAQDDNPLLRCGVVLAGANIHNQTVNVLSAEDGFLSALEITSLDLRGTQLVVLSACESGLGELRNGEGVSGLHRAFTLAGAKTVVSTLWAVPDEPTARMVASLYSGNDGSLPMAMRSMMLKEMQSVHDRGLPDLPFIWGAFIAVGDWRIASATVPQGN